MSEHYHGVTTALLIVLVTGVAYSTIALFAIAGTFPADKFERHIQDIACERVQCYTPTPEAQP